MKILYAKYNRSRKPEFQTETVIFGSGSEKFVTKRALSDSAKKHIASIRDKCAFVKSNLVSGALKLPEIIDSDGQSVTFRYVEGASLDEMLFDAVLAKDHSRFFSVLDDYAGFFTRGIKTFDSFLPGAEENASDYEFEAQLYKNVDMRVIGQEKLFFQCVLLDSVFDNIIVKDDFRYFIDNEWIFRSSVPVSFVVYRSLVGFYEHKHDSRRMRAFVSLEELLARFGISSELAALYHLMDDNFQEYVIGPSREYQIRRHYLKPVETLENIKARLKGHEAHAVELNDMIVSQEECMRVLGQKSVILDSIFHSRSWVIIRKLCDLIDRMAPFGSCRRRILNVAGKIMLGVYRTILMSGCKKLFKRRPVILVVDDRVPHFDQDAGSQTSFAYIKLFVKKGFDVKFLADSFQGDQPYTAELERLGVDMLVGPWYRANWQSWVMENSSKLDYIYLNRPHVAIKYIDFFKQNTSAKIIYYGHDLHWLRFSRLYELYGDVDALKQSDYWREIESKIFVLADVVYFPSDVEVALVKKDFPATTARVIPAYIYNKPALPSIDSFHVRQDLLFVGGFAHAPNEDAVKWFATEVLPIINRKMSGLKFVVVGKNPPETIKSLASDHVIIKGLVSSDELSCLYNSTRIVVIPLRYGAGVKGKTVEAMANGVPAVSTIAGVEGLSGVEQFLPVADTPQEFASEVLAIYNDYERWVQVAEKSVNYVACRFLEESAEQALAHDVDFKK